MRGTLSVILANIYMVRAENDVVKPTNPTFYKRFVDDIYKEQVSIRCPLLSFK